MQDPPITGAFFHTPNLIDATTAVEHLKSGKVKGVWIERYEVTSTGGKWWAIRGLEY